MTVSQRLKELRGDMTLAKFVEPLGVTISAISNVEHEKSKMSIDLAEKICEVYGCTMDWLVRGIGTRDGKPIKVEQPKGNYVVISPDEVVISKDQLIALQSQALKGKDKEIGQLQNQIQSLKNIEVVPPDNK